MEAVDKLARLLFIRDRVYLRYAARFLPPEQVDRRDFDDLLSPRP